VNKLLDQHYSIKDVLCLNPDCIDFLPLTSQIFGLGPGQNNMTPFTSNFWTKKCDTIHEITTYSKSNKTPLNQH